MPRRLANDELYGLLIAGAIGAFALGLYTYRTLVAPTPTTTHAEELAVSTSSESDAARESERDAFAEALEVAFVNDGADAAVDAKDTTLAIVWFPCSKPMLDRLLRKRNDALTKRVREASGLSIARLKALGFTQVTCDNTRGAKTTDDLRKRR
jgi:hypothetical protein